MPETITLYTAKICPYAQRAELALEEAKADYTKYQIDLQNKPEWYAPKVNPASKVPALAYGGPAVPADQPSPESVKLAESLILVEFVADLYPHAHLLPSDPVQKARARFFIDVVSTKLVPSWNTVLRAGAPDADQAFLSAVDAVQSLLPAQGYAVGEYSIADIAIAPFIARAYVALGNEIGAYEPGQGKKLLEALQQPRFARFQKYWADLQARPSFQATFDKEYVTEAFRKRFGNKQ
ncbi:glutathione S-transferase [Fomitopsis serialis]|uniref:glutathione S-transferase n=1 Tax=Fomitopsis serialis TaxID=139415 RepID=UPI002007BB75|nr:glutathione S-transferase [Neoantrodia serialis]KAH9932321.1 glutathione S-transferase [Neoantrodia serialis]